MSKKFHIIIIVAILALATSAAWPDINVTFRVFMGYQTGFPQDTVVVRGSLLPLSWADYVNLLTDTDADSVYEGTVTFSDDVIGDTLEYKFVYRYAGSDVWEWSPFTHGANRILVLPATDTILPIAYFSDMLRPLLRRDVKVTFNVSLEYYAEAANVDNVSIAGDVPPLFWILGFPPYMAPVDTDSIIWTADITFTKGTFPFVHYKYQAHDPLSGWTWEPIPVDSSRSFWINDSDSVQILPIDYYGILGVGIEEKPHSPNKFRLQNYPNPFSYATVISYQLPIDGGVTLKIYNILGQEVRTLVSKSQEAGYHTVRWDGKDNTNRKVSSGIYFYRLEFERFAKIKAMLLIR